MPVNLLPTPAPDTRMAELDALLSAPAPAIEQMPKPPADYMPLRVRQVLAGWAEYAGTTINGLRQGSRSRHLVGTRKQAMRKLREMGFSATEIARWMQVHHTTVLYHLGALKPKAKEAPRG